MKPEFGDPNGLDAHHHNVMSSAASLQAKVDIFPLSAYTVLQKRVDPSASGLYLAERTESQTQRMSILNATVTANNNQPRRTVEAVVLVHLHNFPHVLVLEVGGSLFTLPGGYCSPDEDEQIALQRHLSMLFSPDDAETGSSRSIKWDIVDLLGRWHRPNCQPVMHPYPLPHVSKPKEIVSTYLISLNPSVNSTLCVPQIPQAAIKVNLKAIPLFELHNANQRYGTAIASLPLLLSRYHMNCLSS